MICKSHPRYCNTEFQNTFFITRRTEKATYQELREWAAQHPDSWIWISDCGTHPAIPVPLPEHIIEVHYEDKEPDSWIVFMMLYQRGRRT